ncbi:phenylalanine--tRNA ligase subunit beta [Hwanghaeella sp. LZ110]|uniref:phenylalanine--tRNA ligase subunit beta n=1 Tax=Hwanghaeella sp. LZ110 TaxID=3402810 RepID=UPI003B67C7DC
MKFTLSWLKDHLETDASLTEITDALTSLGLELEGVDDPAAKLGPFTIAYVREAKQHPNADRLRVCMVETGTGEVVQVVCGAPNARTGMKGVFAPAGSHIPGTGVDLKPGVIRGEESNGMLCSEREMGLSDDHDGIIDLPEDAPIGMSFAEYRGLNDPVIDIAITPDRGDCLGVRGVARDLAAKGLGTLKPLDLSPVEGTYDSPIQWARSSDIGSDVPYVAGRHFRGVKNGPSPAWMQRRLIAIGLRPISALVDITNYVSFDLGRPLHVFDAAKLQGDTLTMRRAQAGETILALDEKTYTLEDGMPVIGDAAGPQGIGGVMGGELSGCTDDTTEVFLEVALFDAIRVAETGRRLNIDSDARYRFERGLDTQGLVWGPDVAARLVQKLCGGEVSRPTSAGEIPDNRKTLTLRTDRLESFGGLAVPAEECQAILDRLGFETTRDGDVITAITPTWRNDVEHEQCLIEEVLRVKGFDAIPAVSLERETALPQPILTLGQRRVAFAKKQLAQRGMFEAVTWSFLAKADAVTFGGDPQVLALANPISADLDAMRPSILPNLLAAAQRNTGRGYPDLALFEVGPVFRGRGPKDQDMVATGIRAGKQIPRHWMETSRSPDVFDAKADVMAVLEACGAPIDRLQVGDDVAPDWYHPGRFGTLRLGPMLLARFGEIHPAIAKHYDLRGRVAAFEIFMDVIPQPKAKKGGGKTRPLLKASPLQPVGRDFAFLVDADVSAEKVVRAVLGADKALITDVSVFDVYQGADMAGKKSIALAVTLQPVDATLTDKDLDALAEKVVTSVHKATGGVLRG